MKLLIFLFCFLTIFIADARVKLNDPVVVSDNVTISEPVQPDMMSSGFSITYNNADSTSVSDAMSSMTALIKPFSSICSFSDFKISPDFSTSDKSKSIAGYSGSLETSCLFKDISTFEKLTNTIAASVGKSVGYSINIMSAKWIVSKKVIDAKRVELKSRVLKDIAKTVKDYSLSLGRQCYLKDITINSDEIYPIIKDNPKSKASVYSENERTTVTISISAKFTAACK